MADNSTGLNAQYDPGGGPFPGIAPWGTRAPGSAGITAEATAGGEVGRPVVMGLYDSAQDPSELTRVPVEAGDTSSFSDDNPAHASQIMAGPASDYVSDGPRPNRAGHYHRYPWQQPDGRA